MLMNQQLASNLVSLGAMGRPRPHLFIFVLFKRFYARIIVDTSGIRTRIVRVKGDHSDY